MRLLLSYSHLLLELVVVLELPLALVREVRIVEEATSTLSIADSLHLPVTVEEDWLEADVFGEDG